MYTVSELEEVVSKSEDYIGKLTGPDKRFWSQKRSFCYEDCGMAGLCMKGSCICLNNASKNKNGGCGCGENCLACKFNENKLECGECNGGTVLSGGECSIKTMC